MKRQTSPPPDNTEDKKVIGYGITIAQAILVFRNMSIAARGITFDEWLQEQLKVEEPAPYWNEKDFV